MRMKNLFVCSKLKKEQCSVAPLQANANVSLQKNIMGRLYCPAHNVAKRMINNNT